MVFFTYKYLSLETKHLKIISTYRTNVCKHSVVFFYFFIVFFSGAKKTFKLELFVTEYGELLIFL